MNNLISTIEQEVYLFDGTIEENISLYNELNEKELDEIIKKTRLDKVLERKNATIQTKIFENGLNLSGGEKQRIALARALARKSEILILDEATASLDNDTSNFILRNILNEKELTVIEVTHHMDPKNIDFYDEVIEIKNGRVESITKKELSESENMVLRLKMV